MAYFAHIIEADGNMSTRQRNKFGLAVDDPNDSYIYVSVIEQSKQGAECLDSFYYVFDKVWARQNEDLFWAEIKTRANAIIASNGPKIKQINDLVNIKISL